MANIIKSWQIVDGNLSPIDSSLSENSRTEAYDLEEWIVANPQIIGTDLLIIGRQAQTVSGPLDLLAIDRSGNLVVVELKRDKLPREALAQAIDYVSDVASWSIDKIQEVCNKQTGKDLEDLLGEAFPEENLDNLIINGSQRIILVGFGIKPSLERMVNWLSENYGVSVNAIVLHYSRTTTGEEILSRTLVISEDIAEQRESTHKFKIKVSDTPGNYPEEELRELLFSYFRRNLVTAKRIRLALLPMCLKNESVTRDQLKQKLLELGEVEDLTRAGFALSVISGQINMQKNDFLRQVIGYGYPTYHWEKDNYQIREGYRSVVEAIVNEFNNEQ